jgi:hypothetical protein
VATREASQPEADAARPIDHRLRPIYAVWEITLACDLACRHCGSRAGRGRPDELTTTEALDLIDQMARLDVKEVTLIGGEAYLRDDWLNLVRAIGGHRIPVTMTSGGRGLTAAVIDRAKAAGLKGVSISIDGDEPTHDRLRGVAGSYRSAIAAMRAVKESGMSLRRHFESGRRIRHLRRASVAPRFVRSVWGRSRSRLRCAVDRSVEAAKRNSSTPLAKEGMKEARPTAVSTPPLQRAPSSWPYTEAPRSAARRTSGESLVPVLTCCARRNLALESHAMGWPKTYAGGDAPAEMLELVRRLVPMLLAGDHPASATLRSHSVRSMPVPASTGWI